MIHPIENWRTYDDNGVMMPWYTRPCLEWLDKLPISKMNVFEYGCGVSSLWFTSRNADLKGVDSNQEWIFLPEYQLATEDKTTYLEQVHIDKRARPREDPAITEYRIKMKEYDLIIIDGLYRDDCTEHALKNLKKGGYLIADNFEQPEVEPHWPKTRELTKNLPITIYKEPTHPNGWQTAVWQNI